MAGTGANLATSSAENRLHVVGVPWCPPGMTAQARIWTVGVLTRTRPETGNVDKRWAGAMRRPS